MSGKCQKEKIAANLRRIKSSLTACIRNPENESVSDLPFKDDILY